MVAEIYRGTVRGHEKGGYRKENISFLTIGKRTWSRWRAMRSVCCML